MATYGSNPSLSSQAIAGLVDELGNSLVSTATNFGASPTGISIRTEALFGIANATFDLLPPDPEVKIGPANPLPFWDIEDLSSGSVTATSTFDETTGTWAVLIDPTTAGSADSFTLKTRSFFVTDDNLALRQQAYLTLEKVGTYSSTSQWAAVLSAEYFDHVGASLGTYAIGTVADNTTWTGISGFTTSGGSAISSSASYVDLSFTLTTTAAVTSSIKIKVKSALLYSSTGGGASSFIVTDTFTSNGTWTRPTGVDYLTAVIAIGGGAGGWGNNAVVKKHSSGTTIAGNGELGNAPYGGGCGRWAYLTNFYIGDQSTVSIGVGAGGAGGAGGTANKPAGTTTTSVTAAGIQGAAGGASTFGAYLTSNGGTADTGTASQTTSVFGAVGTAIQAGISVVDSASGTAASTTSAGAGSAAFGTAITSVPFTIGPVAGGGGGAGAFTKDGTATTTIVSGTPTGGSAGAAGLLGAGAGGGGAKCAAIGTALTPTFQGASNGTAGVIQANSGGGAGGGGAAVTVQGTATSGGTVTITATGGSGGTAGYYGSGGGGGGGAVILCGNSAFYDRSILTATGGAGGAGRGGIVVVAYVG